VRRYRLCTRPETRSQPGPPGVPDPSLEPRPTALGVHRLVD
jgi:hypothetical protein